MTPRGKSNAVFDALLATLWLVGLLMLPVSTYQCLIDTADTFYYGIVS